MAATPSHWHDSQQPALAHGYSHITAFMTFTVICSIWAPITGVIHTITHAVSCHALFPFTQDKTDNEEWGGIKVPTAGVQVRCRSRNTHKNALEPNGAQLENLWAEVVISKCKGTFRGSSGCCWSFSLQQTSFHFKALSPPHPPTCFFSVGGLRVWVVPGRGTVGEEDGSATRLRVRRLQHGRLDAGQAPHSGRPERWANCEKIHTKLPFFPKGAIQVKAA